MAGNPFDQFDASTPNPFDQFDQADPQSGEASPFDQFDPKAQGPNPFDQFDASPAQPNPGTPANAEWRSPLDVGKDVVLGNVGNVARTTGSLVRAGNRVNPQFTFPGFTSAIAGLFGRMGWDGAQKLSDDIEATTVPGSEFLTSYADSAQNVANAMDAGQSSQRQQARREMSEAMRGGTLNALGHAVTNPLDLAETASESLGLMGIGKVAGTSARAITGSAGVAVPAMLASEGGMSVAASVDAARQAINELPTEELTALPGYDDLVAEYGDQVARKVLEGRAANQAGFAAVVLQTLTAGATRKLSAVEEAFAGQAGRSASRLANAGTAFVKEGLQEGAQGGAEQVATNFGTSASDSRVRLMDNVGAAAVMEAGAGGPLGALFGLTQSTKPVPKPGPLQSIIEGPAPNAQAAPGAELGVPQVDGSINSEPPPPASVAADAPIAITRAMRDELRARGVKPGDIARMSPMQAAEMLTGPTQTAAPTAPATEPTKGQSFAPVAPAAVPPPSRLAFDEPDVEPQQAFAADMRKFGVPEESIQKHLPKVSRDDVTGFFDARAGGIKTKTVERAQKHVEETNEPAIYFSADIFNLGGLNEHFGNKAEQANPHYRAITNILNDEIKATGADLVPMRTGGDETGAVAVNLTADAARGAIDRAQAKIAAYTQEHGLAGIEHPKRKGELGVGLHVGFAKIEPGRKIADIFNDADDGVNASKQGYSNVVRNETAETGPVPLEGQPGRIASSDVGADRGIGKDKRGIGNGSPIPLGSAPSAATDAGSIGSADQGVVAPAAAVAAPQAQASSPLSGAKRVADGILVPGEPSAIRSALRDAGIKGAFAKRGDGIILQGKPQRDFVQWQSQQVNEPTIAAAQTEPAAAEAGSPQGELTAPRANKPPANGDDALTQDDAQFSRVSGTDDFEGIPVEVAQRAVDEFRSTYRGNIPVEFRVVNTLEDAYGPGATERAGRAGGAYHPKRRVLVLAAANLRDAGEATRTLRHEILAHHGLNTFAPADKKAVLERLASTRPGKGASSPGMRKLWANIEQRYGDLSELMQAEEVFALAAEQERSALGKAWDEIASIAVAALRKVGLIKGAITPAEVRATIQSIARSIRAGTAKQQTFPESDQAQFSRKPDDAAEIRRAAASAAERAAGRVRSREQQQTKQDAAPKSDIDLRKFDFTPPGAKQGIFAKASQDVRDQVAAFQKLLNGRPQNPQTILERLNDTRAAIFDSIMSRARALERRNPKAPSLRKLFNLAMAAPGDSRLVHETVNDAIASRFSIFTNRTRNILAENGLEKMTDAENASLRETMLGTAKNPLPKISKAAAEIRQLMNVQREDLIAAGVEVGEVSDVGYLTRMYDDARILSDETGFLKTAEELYEKHEFAREVGADARGILYEPGKLAQFLTHAKRARDPAVATGLKELRAAILTYRRSGALTEVKEVERIVGDMYAAVAKSYAHMRAASWLHAIKTPNVAQYVNGIGPSGAPVTKERVLSGAADTVMAPYLKTDMLDILDTYGRKVAQKIEHATRFGPKGEKLQQLVDAASSEGVPAGDLEQAVDLAESALGLKPRKINPKLKAGFDFIHAWTYLALLPKAAFSSVMEAVTFSIRTGQLRHTIAPLVQVARALSKNSKIGGYSSTELSAMAQAIGVNGHLAVEEVLMNRLGGDYAMTPQWSRLLHRFFKANLLTPLTRAQRAYGVGAATGYLRSLATRARDGKASSDTAGLLNELGIADHRAFSDWLLAQTAALPDPTGLFDTDGRATPRGQDYMAAVRRIIDQSIQNPSAAHRPAWTNNPTGRLVTGIMSFSYASYENVIKGTLKRAARGDGAKAYAQRIAPVLAGAGALVLAQTLASTVRELLFNASRFEDKDDDEIAEELLALGLSRTFGLGSGDPLVQYLTGLKYQRTLAETALGAGPGLIAQAVDAAGSIASDRNSGNTDTAEYRAMQKAYGVTIAPIMNALLSRVPLIGGVAMIELSDKAYRDQFASAFFTPPEPRSHLDNKYQEAVAGVDNMMDEVEGRIALLPKEQWADELDKLKTEYPALLEGVTLDTYVPNTQNRRAGRYGPKQTKEGKPRLKLAQGDFGSVLGELEGYPYFDLRTRSMKNSEGIEDEIRELNRAIKNVPEATTQADLISFVVAIDPNADVLADLRNDTTPATSAQRDAAREELMTLRRDLKREAIELINRGERGEPIMRGGG